MKVNKMKKFKGILNETIRKTGDELLDNDEYRNPSTAKCVKDRMSRDASIIRE